MGAPAKRFMICAAIASGLAVTAYTIRDGDVIKIHVTGGDASGLIADFNATVGPSIKLEEVELGADVTLSFRERDLSSDGEDGNAQAALGNIAISSTANDGKHLDLLVHELLHCAGEGHESEPGSIMQPGARDWTLRDDQIRDLRRLSGITYPERFIAHIRGLIPQPGVESGINWGALARNRLAWFFASIVIGSAIGLRWLKVMERANNERARKNKIEERDIEIGIRREIERERQGLTKGPKDPYLAHQWEEMKRQRRR